MKLVDAAGSFALHLLALAFALLIYLWVFVGLFLGWRLAERCWPGRGEDFTRKVAFSLMLTGAGIIWAAWTWLLPEWWKAMVPGIAPAIVE